MKHYTRNLRHMIRGLSLCALVALGGAAFGVSLKRRSPEWAEGATPSFLIGRRQDQNA